jgi:hypothetical protein
MKFILIILFSIIIISCNENNETKFIPEPIVQKGVDIFTPGTSYFTAKDNFDFVEMKRKPYNLFWEEKGYNFFKDVRLDSFNHQHFEMVDIFGDKNHIILFNERKETKDSIEHLILDTLFNFSKFADSLENIGTSVGILSKEGMMGINIDTINTNAIVSITQSNDESAIFKEIDSALNKKNKKPLETITITRKGNVLKAWFANTKTKKFQVIK